MHIYTHAYVDVCSAKDQVLTECREESKTKRNRTNLQQKNTSLVNQSLALHFILYRGSGPDTVRNDFFLEV